MICRFILSCSREEDFLAQLSLLCPELSCVTSPSLPKAGEWDLCFLLSLETGTSSETGLCSVGEQSPGVEWLTMVRGSEAHSLVSS